VSASDEHEREIVAACEDAVRRLGTSLEDPEISCLLRRGDVLRNVAQRARLRLIFEIPREHGGVVWRTVECGEPQLVEDVRSDPDYLTTDPSVRSEISAPVRIDAEVLAVLDVEFPDRVFTDEDVALVRDEAERLAGTLRRYVS
jgi:GAF domain-containing protein